MHEHCIDRDGETVDVVKLCSDACNRDWCADNGETYDGWAGCHETEFTDWCAQCGVVLPGQDADPCQLANVVVNRFSRADGERCEHGAWIQLPARMVTS